MTESSHRTNDLRVSDLTAIDLFMGLAFIARNLERPLRGDSWQRMAWSRDDARQIVQTIVEARSALDGVAK